MFVVFFNFIFCDTQTSNNILHRESGVIFSTDKFASNLTISRGIKTQHTPRDLVWLVNKFNCLAYDWTVNHERRVSWHDHIWNVSCMLVYSKKRRKRRYNKHLILNNLIWFEFCNLIGWSAWRKFWLYLITWVGIVTYSFANDNFI